MRSAMIRREHVDRAAGRGRHHHGDRPARIVLRHAPHRQSQQRRRANRSSPSPLVITSQIPDRFGSCKLTLVEARQKPVQRVSDAPLAARSAVRRAHHASRRRPEAREAVSPPARPRGRAARVVDLLFHLPTGAIDRRARPKLRDVVPGTVVTVAVRSTAIARRRPTGRARRTASTPATRPAT